MKILDFLFELVKQHVPMESQQFGQLRLDGQSWYNKLGATTAEGEEAHPLLLKFKALSEQWYTQLGLAVAFIFATKWLHEFMQNTDDDDDDDDE